MNDVRYYRDLLADSERIEMFQRAISRVVQEGDRVLEIGTGLGTYSLFAAAAGAQKVTAVDGAPVVHVAKAIAEANGFDERIEFVRGWVPDVVVGERVDVVIFEDFPTTLLDAGTLRLLRSLRQDYAAPGARMVPRRLRTFMAPVRAPKTRKKAFSFSPAEGENKFGIDWSESRVYAANTPFNERLKKKGLAGPPAPIGDLWVDRPDETDALDGVASWRFDTAEVVHGLAWWFDIEVSEDQWISNGPGSRDTVWGQILLPLDPPLEVAAGAEISAEIRRDKDRDGAPAWFSWRVASGETVARGHEFAAAPSSLSDLVSLNHESVPRLTEAANRERVILGLVDGRTSIGDIAARLRAEDPSLSESRALRAVIDALQTRLDNE